MECAKVLAGVGNFLVAGVEMSGEKFADGSDV